MLLSSASAVEEAEDMESVVRRRFFGGVEKPWCAHDDTNTLFHFI